HPNHSLICTQTLINEYDNEIVKLRKDLHAAREKNGVYLSQDTYNELLQNLELKNTEIAECQNDQKALEGKHLQISQQNPKTLKP
ncbi:hypothetical protein SARC_18052, partial [Sphaeroforma arctica JP610]